jgi:hypothetical protein
MSEAAAAVPSASPDTGSGVSVVAPQTLEQRSAAAFGLPDPTADASADSPAEGEAAVGSAEPDAAAQARAARREALAKLQTEERGRVDAMAAIRERDELRTRLAAAEARQKEYEQRIDPSTLADPAQFFALAEKAVGSDPTKLYEWMRERMANPELAAVHAAKKAIDPDLAAVKAENAALKKQVEDFLASQTQTKEAADEAAAEREFFAFTSENAATSPHSARFLQEYGPDEFVKLARRAVQSVPAHGGAQAILDEIEENLTAFGRMYAPQTGASTQRRQASPPQAPAAAQAPTTISNTLAQQRSSVVDEDSEWAALPFEERSARLFR